MKTKNFKVKADSPPSSKYLSVVAAAANMATNMATSTTVTTTTDEVSCMLFQIERLREMIQKTILAQHQYKLVDILSTNDINLSIQYLEKIYRNFDVIETGLHSASSKTMLELKYEIKLVMSEMSSIFRNYGTHSIGDLLEVTIGSDHVKYATASVTAAGAASTTSGIEWDHKKYEVLKMYFHPIHFKMLPWKNERKSATNDKLIQKNRIVEDFMIVEKSMNLDCFDLARTNKNFASRVFGIKVAVHNYVEQKTLIINGLVDNVLLDCISCEHVTNRISILWKNVPKDPEFMAESFTKYIKSLSLKDIFQIFIKRQHHSTYEAKANIAACKRVYKYGFIFSAVYAYSAVVEIKRARIQVFVIFIV